VRCMHRGWCGAVWLGVRDACVHGWCGDMQCQRDSDSSNGYLTAVLCVHTASVEPRQFVREFVIVWWCHAVACRCYDLVTKVRWGL
jgi:hypothetical protein